MGTHAYVARRGSGWVGYRGSGGGGFKFTANASALNKEEWEREGYNGSMAVLDPCLGFSPDDEMDIE